MVPRGRYASFTKLFYETTNGTCGGHSDASDVFTPTTCTYVGNSLSGKSMWCGAPCTKWKTLRASQPLCDPPGSGRPHAVDLSKVS